MPDVLRSCATIATSPNQQGTEGRSSGAICRWTDECVILPVFSLVGSYIFLPSKEAHLCLFYKLFPSFVYHTLLTTCLLTSRCASRGRGGKRDDVGWPRDRKKRLHAIAELVRKWEKKQGYVETWKAWEDMPLWVRINEAGLRNLGLDWNEIPFPEKRKRLLPTAHAYQVNKRRLALARGSADAPKHDWLCERAILYEQLKQDPNMIRAHRPDGVLVVKADGSFPFKRGD